MNRSCLVSSAIRVRRCIYQVPNCSSPVVASTTRAFKSWIGSGTELGNRLHSIEYPAIPLPGVGSRAGLQRTVTQVSLDVSPIWWALLKTLAGSSGIGVSKTPEILMRAGYALSGLALTNLPLLAHHRQTMCMHQEEMTSNQGYQMMVQHLSAR